MIRILTQYDQHDVPKFIFKICRLSAKKINWLGKNIEDDCVQGIAQHRFLEKLDCKWVELIEKLSERMSEWWLYQVQPMKILGYVSNIYCIFWRSVAKKVMLWKKLVLWFLKLFKITFYRNTWISYPILW